MSRRSSLFTVWPYLWRSQWRRGPDKSRWAGADALAVGAWLIFLASRLFPLGARARLAMVSDPEGAGIAATGALLVVLQVVWIASLLTTGGVPARAGGFAIHKLAHLPLRDHSLLAISGAAILSQPLTWGHGLISLCALPALLAGPFPFVGAVAFVAHFVFMIATGLAASQLLAALMRSRRASAIAALLFLLLIAVAALALDRDLLNFESVRREVSRTPAGWTAHAATGGSWRLILLLLVASGAALALGFFAFVKSYRRLPSSSHRAVTRSWLPGWLDGSPFRAAVKKELIYLGHTLDIRLGMLLSGAGALLLLLHREPLPWVPMVVLSLAVYGQLGIAHNSFGLDGEGVARYRLLPLSGRSIVFSKNLAYLGWVIAEYLPLGLVGLAKFGGGAAVGCFGAFVGFAVWTLVWGNHASIAVPARRHFGGFDSTDQVGGLALVGLATVAFAGALTLVVAAWQRGMGTFVAASAALAATGVLIWRLQLARAGRAFERHGESMRALLE